MAFLDVFSECNSTFFHEGDVFSIVPLSFSLSISFMKKIICFVTSFVIAFCYFCIPVSAVSSGNQFNLTYNASNFNYDGTSNFVFATDDSAVNLQTLRTGPFWSTSIRPGYLSYCSGRVSSNFDYQYGQISTPKYYRWIGENNDIIYVNRGDFISVTADLVLYSKSKMLYDWVVFCVEFTSVEHVENNSTGIVPSVAVRSEPFLLFDSEGNGFNENLYENCTFQISTANIPDKSFISCMYFEVFIGDFKNVSAFDSGAFGFGIFYPGLEMFIGPSENAPIYNQPSRDSVDEEQELIAGIENQLSDGTSEVNDLFSNFDSLFGESGHIYKGLLAASNMLNSWLGIDFISPVVTFSLLLGIFSFLIGSAYLITRSVKLSDSKAKHSFKENKTDYKKSGG